MTHSVKTPEQLKEMLDKFMESYYNGDKNMTLAYAKTFMMTAMGMDRGNQEFEEISVSV